MQNLGTCAEEATFPFTGKIYISEKLNRFDA